MNKAYYNALMGSFHAASFQVTDLSKNDQSARNSANMLKSKGA